MNKALLMLLLMVWSGQLFAQTKLPEKAQAIVEEGKRLYKSEMASWYGTDLFVAEYKDMENVGGYFSYSERDTSKCVFYSKEEKPRVIGTISFDSTFAVGEANVNLETRIFSNLEKDLFEIRQSTIAAIDSDTLFKQYENTSLNLIPIVDGKEKKVYVLTGPQVNGVVIFGNDYLIRFDENNQILEKRQLHKNIIPFFYGQENNEGEEPVGAMHSHLPETGDFITPTDICTLMLYGKYAKWKTHNVVSDKYLNIWNCETNELSIESMDLIKKISKDQEKKKGKKK